MFVTIFILAFLATDYLYTGSVTETWIGIAVITGVMTAFLRWAISQMAEAMLQ